MKRLPYIAAVAYVLLLLQLGDGYALDAFDGEWVGSARPSGGRCEPARVTLTVRGKVVVGQARFEPEAQNINGTVREDGTFGATIGFQPLTGKFTDNGFEGTFKRSDCAWKMDLKREK